MSRYDGFSTLIAITSRTHTDPLEVIREHLPTIFFDVGTGHYSSSVPDGAFQLFDPEPDPTLARCPFSGDIVGMLAIEPWSEDVFRWVVENLLYAGAGYAVDLRVDERFDLAVKREVNFQDIVGRHGFHEGASLLSSGDDYHTYIRAEIARTLKPLGLIPNVYNDGDHPHILCGFDGDDNKPFVQLERD